MRRGCENVVTKYCDLWVAEIIKKCNTLIRDLRVLNSHHKNVISTDQDVMHYTYTIVLLHSASTKCTQYFFAIKISWKFHVENFLPFLRFFPAIALFYDIYDLLDFHLENDHWMEKPSIFIVFSGHLNLNSHPWVDGKFLLFYDFFIGHKVSQLSVIGAKMCRKVANY